MMNREQRIARIGQIDLYPVTCQDLSLGRSNLDVLDGLLQGGARIVQLREKHWDKKDLYEMAVEFRRRTRAYDALLIVNDHLDVALAAGADGVHLGQEDLPLEAARRIAPGMILGASSHSLDEALTAERQGADYVNIGPIFPTETKQGVSRFLGPSAIREIGPRLKIPFTTMGGINRENIHQVLEAGAGRVAMVSGITKARDIAERVRELRSLIKEFTATD
ncbi:MAG: thiamine phosphate synthase [Desulfohalobiaceae bacterium]|nr:thiamine phosphate synthase [Desulfohalobiaceae bacterium]